MLTSTKKAMGHAKNHAPDQTCMNAPLTPTIRKAATPQTSADMNAEVMALNKMWATRRRVMQELSESTECPDMLEK